MNVCATQFVVVTTPYFSVLVSKRQKLTENIIDFPVTGTKKYRPSLATRDSWSIWNWAMNNSKYMLEMQLQFSAQQH